MIWIGLFLEKRALGEVIKYLSQHLNETQTLSYLALIVGMISSACKKPYLFTLARLITVQLQNLQACDLLSLQQ